MVEIPFDIKYRPEIESGKYLVKTGDGNSVEIVLWDKQGSRPIVGAINQGGTKRLEEYFINGRFLSSREHPFDLFLIPNPDYKEPAVKPSANAKPFMDWDAFRREAAKDFVSAILSNSALVHDQSWEHRININVIGSGVAYADELIKQLKEGKK